MKIEKRNEIIVLTLLVIIFLLVNLSLFNTGHHGWDTYVFQTWGNTHLEKGLKAVYTNNHSDYAPLYQYVFLFNSWLTKEISGQNEVYSKPYVFISKIIPTLSNLLIGLILYFHFRDKSKKIAIISFILYCFNLGLIYNTSVWGQLDSVNTLFMLITTIFLLKKKYVPASIFFIISVLIKFQSIVFLPILIILILMNSNIKEINKVLIASTSFIIIVLLFLIYQGALHEVILVYSRYIGEYAYTTLNAFNLWFILSPPKETIYLSGLKDTLTILGISLRTIGLFFMGTYTLIILYQIFKNKDNSTILLGLSSIILGFFLLPTEIHERYLFPFFAIFLLIVPKKKEYLYIYIIYSITYLLNLIMIEPTFLVKILTSPGISPIPSIIRIASEVNLYRSIGISLSYINILTFIYFNYVGIMNNFHKNIFEDYNNLKKRKFLEKMINFIEKSSQRLAKIIQHKKVRDTTFLILIIIISSIHLFSGLGDHVVIDWDEARNAINGLEMLKSGDYIVTTYNNQPDMWNLKPPLGPWLITLSFKLFGVSEFSLRFFSALAGVFTIVLIFLFSRQLTKNNLISLFVSLIILKAQNFSGVHGARTGDYDILITFFFTLTFYLFYLYEKKHNKYFLYATAIPVSLAILTKEIIGLIPLVIIALYLLIRYLIQKKKVIFKDYIIPLLIIPLVSAPWFILRGSEFFIKMIQTDIINRATTVLEGNAGPFYLYPEFLLKNFGILTMVFFIISLIYIIYTLKKKNYSNLLFLIWFILPFTIFSISKTKTSWYLLPIYPSIALIIGLGIKELINEFPKYKKLLSIFLIVVIALSFTYLNNKIENDPTIESVRDLKQNFNAIDNIYVHFLYPKGGDARQPIIFYLESYIKGNVTIVRESLKKEIFVPGDYIFTYQNDTKKILNKDPTFTIINKSGECVIYQKIED